MVGGDRDEIGKEYEIVLKEVGRFNGEMVEKEGVLGIRKCEMVEEEVMEMVEGRLGEDIGDVFICWVCGMGMEELKELVWGEVNKESKELEGVGGEGMVDGGKDMRKVGKELEDMGEEEEFEYEYEDVDEDDEFE